MAFPITSSFTITFISTLLLLFKASISLNNTWDVDEHWTMSKEGSIPTSDADLLEFALNLEYLEAEFFLWGSVGHGLDQIDPTLAEGGPQPYGAQKASLDNVTQDVIYQFALQEVGHLRAIKKTVKGFPRPLLNLSASNFASVIDSAFETHLRPPFNPYANSTNFLIASYLIPYVGLTGYVGAIPKLQSPAAKKLVAGLLAVEAGQDAVIRTLLYERRAQSVGLYQRKVEWFANTISKLRNKLGKGGLKDEGLLVPPKVGAEGKVGGNILAGDKYSLGYPRTPEEILRIVYGSGDEKKVGGFFPKGAKGKIAKSHYDNVNSLNHKHKRSKKGSIPSLDVDLLEFPLNLEYLEAEFFLWGSVGYGLDKVDPKLANGGDAPFGAQKAFLDPVTRDVIYQFGLQEVGHLRAIKKTVKGFPRPLLNMSASHFANVIDEAFGYALKPPFNPYANSINFLLASYLIPYVGLTGYVGAADKLQSPPAKKLVAGLLAVESGQDAIIRGLLYDRRLQKVAPYGITVQEFTDKISKLRNKLGKAGTKDVGLGSAHDMSKGKGGILAGDEHAVGYPRSPEQILRIVYGSGDEKTTGGFYPEGAYGKIAQHYHK
ncbi:hypothetical protein Cgig2_024508 [Carnegiea gigantea]|uniref:Desiccation-related protein PCC13-62 n=1 Tax=Carnegiea gigantea TaxID=171969 RepID=A0A9Q1QK80_9CARY|nr:hypothetical protein Cgig2_024508 [Carnegiea gigantea]